MQSEAMPAAASPAPETTLAQPELPGMPPAPAARPPAGRRGAAMPPAEAIETAVLAALDSPAVQARLAGLVEQAVAAALPAAIDAALATLRGATGAAGAPPAAASRPTVLVTGLTAAQAQTLAQQTRDAIDVRFWHAGESREQLRLLARACSVAVLAGDAVDPDLEAFLQSLPLRLVHHGASLARLRDRLFEIGERGSA